ncbi:sensor histidine kinase [Bacteroides sp. AM07-18]|jgi:signal transduction histidine kinase|uniref:histidine kinase n=1 Tax=Bacteroides uniformis TaxID=820 RepID=A0A414JTN5_BACUN|nr:MULTISPECIES: HAMP domain-containing sensor histidine kinase [Bacteroides]RJU30064.1 sensor histidine kinase [Bacteroides sp. AM51-7]MBV4215343.1 HAMP domain-containing histidine kinase [Bacteroides uniformis]MBV4228968.1 HAMP domain-containing histidine kinase [Bacteroides uniformis]MCB7403080.1 HAMP domain-containing histidine kinase [Bacteroides uniformis]MCB7414221.1 HAMP domain-containing histidine kinase [Bacteroides uniformis]
MRIKQLYIFLFFIWFGSTIIASTTDKADSWTKEKESIVHEVISTFHNSLGFDYLTREECDSLNADGLLSQLDESQRYYTYFELERILIKSSLFRGEIRMAIAQSDQMYSKARALAYPFGNALALNAMGEVYSYTGRLREAGAAYEESLRLLDGMDGEDVHIRMLLVELIDYNLRIRNVNGASRYLARLNLYPEDRLSPLELAMRHISNASCQLFKGDLKAASHCLVQIGQLETQLIPEIRQYLLIIDARYLVATGAHEAALAAYNDFLQTEYARINHNIYKEALLEKADLLVKMGNKEEAYGQYGKVFSYIKTSFEKNYPKEIDRLCTRFQADQLAYQNERDRIVSMRFYLAGIIVSVLFLIFLLVLGWKKIFRLKRSQIRQEAMKEKAVQAIQRKNMFLSNMSHEVRTPLNAIVGFSAVLTDEDESFDDESRREFSEIIKVNSFQLLKLINDILDFSDFENDNITFNIRTHDAVKLCNEVVETVMASRKLEVEMRFDTDLSVLMLDTDDARLRQVLINLLVNATKFTEQGSIVLELKMADAGTALFSVTDTGCGIPPEKQHLIFERFEKLNDFVQGSGLGLSICQLIVKYMNGKLWVDSGYTRGARFCFTHPLKYNPALHGGTAQ